MSVRTSQLPPSIPWVESDALEPWLAASGADDDSKVFARELARDGLAIIDLGDDIAPLIEAILTETAFLFDKPGARRVHDAWRRAPSIRALARHPAILARLKLAYGRRPFAFQSLSFARGSEQDAHADTLHFHSEPERFMCGVWVALEDVRPEAGPLLYYPGSHRLPVLTMRDAGAEDGATTPETYHTLYGPALATRLHAGGFAPRPALLKKGMMAVWAANLAHGGAPITDPTASRRSLVLHYYFEDCLYHTPMMSTAAKRLVRLPDNLDTGGWEWPRREGRRVRVAVKHVVASLLSRWLRLTPRF